MSISSVVRLFNFCITTVTHILYYLRTAHCQAVIFEEVCKHYEDILGIMKNMGLVMELSPHAFFDMGEEFLRFHFLVQLNGVFEGQATGETFNFQGKTDILIRVDGKSIFIAECKFWKGENSFIETIDQLLSYLSWRDTKAAVVVFK